MKPNYPLLISIFFKDILAGQAPFILLWVTCAIAFCGLVGLVMGPVLAIHILGALFFFSFGGVVLIMAMAFGCYMTLRDVDNPGQKVWEKDQKNGLRD
jgi:hypothetical protein